MPHIPEQEMPNSEETKRDRFRRIAKKRTINVIKRLRVLSTCANRNAYEYRPADVEKIFGEIERHVAAARTRFEERNKKDVDFELEP